MSTKTPATKAKKPSAGKPAAKPAKKGPPDSSGDDEAKKKRAAKAAKPGGAREEGDGEGDDDEDDEEEFIPKKSGKPAVEPTAVVPARRLTPEAKAAINAMVAKGVPLDEALRRAGSWETFIAPVKDETQKQFPGGKEGGGPRSPFGGRRPSGPRDKDKSEMPREPGGGFGNNFDDEDPGVNLSDDEPIVAGGDDD